jgi:hypothetical protein
MKKKIVLNNSMTELTSTESAGIIGGGGIDDYFSCVAATLTNPRAAFKTFVLGVGLFGMARLIGVAVGCSSN